MENDGGVMGPWDAQGAQAHSRRSPTPPAGAGLVRKLMENDGGVTGPWDAQGAQAHCRRYTETCLQIAVAVDTKRSDHHYKKPNSLFSDPGLCPRVGK